MELKRTILTFDCTTLSKQACSKVVVLSFLYVMDMGDHLRTWWIYSRLPVASHYDKPVWISYSSGFKQMDYQ